MSESIAHEEQLIRAARNALVGQLTRAAAHELNNPLFVVLGLVELVSLRLDPASKERERLEVALGSGDEIKEILRMLLEIARPDPLDEAPRVLELGEVAAEAVAAARRLTLAKNVAVVADPGSGFPVRGRRAELRQLLLTLLANAQEAQPGGGTVTLDLAAAGDEAVVTIADDGPGVPTEVERRLFEPLAAGLGLAAARAIARAHGGELDLASRPGGGATATVRLPLAR